jgi:ketosteroid isomerase-like protein
MARSIAEVLADFNAAFNRGDLDAVMAAFAETAEYLPGDGSRHVGRAAIRKAFEPQFSGAYGAMRFDVEDELVDEGARKATSRWICRHDMAGKHGARVATLLKLFIKARHGARVGWRGVDVFHFDADGLITGKYTYASYGRPKLERELGVPLAGG